jgi:PPM family protein phosphatase
MGTTVVGLMIDDARIAIGSVGDSRLYLLSGGKLEQLTVDDSWATRILAQDASLNAEAIAQHPMRNVLTNVIGARDTVDVVVTERTLTRGDMLLLCTDGLHGVLSPEHLKQILEETPAIEDTPRRLIDAALDQGSRDNLTALVVRYEG